MPLPELVSCNVTAEIQALYVGLKQASICRHTGKSVLNSGEELLVNLMMTDPAYFTDILNANGENTSQRYQDNTCNKGPCEFYYDYEKICEESFKLYLNQLSAMRTKVFAECF